MTKPAGWEVDVKSLSEREIAKLLRELRGGEYPEVVLDLQREVIRRASREGMTREEIIRKLTQNVPRGTALDNVAREWNRVLGVSVEEFKRIADAR